MIKQTLAAIFAFSLVALAPQSSQAASFSFSAGSGGVGVGIGIGTGASFYPTYGYGVPAWSYGVPAWGYGVPAWGYGVPAWGYLPAVSAFPASTFYTEEVVNAVVVPNHPLISDQSVNHEYNQLLNDQSAQEIPDVRGQQ